MALALVATSLNVAAEGQVGESLPTLLLPPYRGDTAVLRLPLLGKVTYVDFWASWCAPCRSSFPWLDGLQRKYGARGFQVIGINKDMELADAERFLAKYPVGFTLVRDPNDKAARTLSIAAMPTAFLVDRRGHIRLVHKGFRNADMATLETEILTLLEQP